MSSLLDGSRATVSFKDLSMLDCLGCNLGDEVISIEDKGLEQSWWWNLRGVLVLKCVDTHDEKKEG